MKLLSQCPAPIDRLDILQCGQLLDPVCHQAGIACVGIQHGNTFGFRDYLFNRSDQVLDRGFAFVEKFSGDGMEQWGQRQAAPTVLSVTRQSLQSFGGC